VSFGQRSLETAGGNGQYSVHRVSSTHRDKVRSQFMVANGIYGAILKQPTESSVKQFVQLCWVLPIAPQQSKSSNRREVSSTSQRNAISRSSSSFRRRLHNAAVIIIIEAVRSFRWVLL